MDEHPRVIVARELGGNETARLAGEALSRGEVIAFPTDTVYGVAADATNEAAVARLFAAKGRPSDKPLPVLLADADDIERLCSPVPAAGLCLARLWPGPLTIVVPLATGAHLCGAVTAGLQTIGVRVPDHELARAILRAVGLPVAVTSANLSGETEALDAGEVREALGGRVDLIVDGGRCGGGVPSTVVDVTASPPRILRQGAIPESTIRATLA